jgi:hypothetical protein
MGTIGRRKQRRPDDRPIHRIRAGQVIRHREVLPTWSASSPEGPGFLFAPEIKMGEPESRRTECDQPPHRVPMLLNLVKQ